MQFLILILVLFAIGTPARDLTTDSAGQVSTMNSIGFSQPDFWCFVVLPSCLPLLVCACVYALFYSPVKNSHACQIAHRRIETLTCLVWFLSSLCICFVSNWAIVSYQFSPKFTFVSKALFLTPIFLSLVLVWMYQAFQIQRTNSEFNFKKTCGLVWLQVKLQLLTILIPLGIFLIGSDFVRYFTWNPSFTFQLLLLPAVLILVVFLMPKMMAWILPTRSIAKTQLGRQLLELSRACGTPIHDVCVWNTGNRIMNGLVVGILPIGRKILLTDRLIHVMNANQIAAVFLHEVGHANRHHMVLRFLAAAVPFVAIYVLLEVLGVSEIVTVICAAIGSTVCFAGFARTLEYDADRFAVSSMQRLCGDRSSYVESLEIIRSDNPKSDQESWLHPKITSRIGRINSSIAAPVLETVPR